MCVTLEMSSTKTPSAGVHGATVADTLHEDLHIFLCAEVTGWGIFSQTSTNPPT
ncbi:hypothetical protein L798_04572 [Zootermopsis nevadensis]|uniref:Uncharacterized protein n=1 Tax=Zootermopsis nevadensis TaxID=136037 RepID=A0A067RBS0_ZOONE|nr:hypothetical protein L798_04572 [Zootermopsis nevadensis]